MRLLPILVMLALPAMPSPAAAEPLFCYWIETSSTAIMSRALGQDNRVREFRSGERLAPAEIIRRLERAEPFGDPVQPELMAHLRSLEIASFNGPYRDTPGLRTLWANRNTMVACIERGKGRPRPATVILRECHNDTHINTAASAPELMTYLTNLLSPTTGAGAEAERIIRSLDRCY